MKKLITLLCLTLLSTGAFAQSRVTEKDLLGEWRMVIDVDMDEIEEDLENENWLARRIASSVTSLVTDILDEIDIHMDFRSNGEVKIMVEAFGERESEYAEWRINKDGELMIFDEDNRRWKNSHVSFGGDDDVWLMEDGKIVQFEYHRHGRMERGDVYLERVKR
ncbi:hypothetical protein [Roseivirga sp.]|uniref:hypothetical protein n=1 Tax=Roseivirga sp. TaxID=1964215 RepID=UPI003B519B52